jgi:hypothetical protein
MDILIHAEKSISQNSTSFHDQKKKPFNILGIESTNLNIIKIQCDKPQATV